MWNYCDHAAIEQFTAAGEHATDRGDRHKFERLVLERPRDASEIEPDVRLSAVLWCFGAT